MYDLMVLGNGLAGLVSALEAGRRGLSVALLSDGRAPGGHFTGMQVDGLQFDVGMVMLERSIPTHPCNDWSDFDPGCRQDWTRFGTQIWDWMQSQTPLRRVPTPSCLVDGQWWPDYLIANRLDALAQANVELPPSLSPTDPRHARHKLAIGVYDELSYTEAALLNHGAELHTHFIEPFVNKLVAGNSADLLARWHRAAWAPLFYPETLQAALKGQAYGLEEYPFWVPESGCVAQWTQSLQNALVGCGQVTRLDLPLVDVESSAAGWRAVSSDGQIWQSHKAVWATAPARACELLDLPAPSFAPAVSVSVQLCSVARELVRNAWGCAMVVDDEYAAYRLTCADLQAGLEPERLRFTIEANPQRLNQQYPGLNAQTALQRELAALLGLSNAGDLHVHRHLTAPNALALPTAQAIEQASALHARLRERMPDAWMTGSLLGHGLASINDQIAQALQITATLTQ